MKKTNDTSPDDASPGGTSATDQQTINNLIKITKLVMGIVMLLLGGIIFLTYQLNKSPENTQPTLATKAVIETPKPPAATAETQLEDGKDVQTGLLAGDGLQVVKSTCTACHSSALILQNRFTREGWHQTIVWMQETQGLWDLGENEAIILDYLAANYAPEAPTGRRIPLNGIEWYELKE
ncbi:MAG: hypothetical protein RIG62_28275 [Cyclobacteriaceae bacterium]